MKHISEVVYQTDAPEKRPRDAYVRIVFRNVPRPLWQQMLKKHSGSEAHVHECWECWVVAKQVWERKRAIEALSHV